jgi:hypothetical protein
MRRELEGRMTADEIAEAKLMAKDWKPSKP